MNSFKCPKCNLVPLPDVSICRKCGFDFANRLIVGNDSKRWLNEYISSFLRPGKSGEHYVQVAKFRNLSLQNYFDDFFDIARVISEEERAKKEQAEILKIMFMNAVEVGFLSNKEFDSISKFYAESVLTEAEYKKISETIFKHCVRLATNSRFTHLFEQQVLEHLARRLDISQELQNWMRKKINFRSAAVEDEIEK
jgi:hypothetical protein